MANTITKSDLSDIDFVDSQELISDGYYSNAGMYLISTIVSTTSGSKEIVINLPADFEGISDKSEHPAASGDYVWLSGTSGADGYYTIDQIIDNLTFSVIENINTSTGGNINFFYSVGSKQVGFNPTGLTYISSNNVQDAIKEVDSVLGTLGALPSGAHGSILFFNGLSWVLLPPFDDGYILTTHDVGNDPTWEKSSSLPTADASGQLLISDETLEFKPYFPLRDDETGFALITEEGQLMLPD